VMFRFNKQNQMCLLLKTFTVVDSKILILKKKDFMIVFGFSGFSFI